jgi:hypothetical protein
MPFGTWSRLSARILQGGHKEFVVRKPTTLNQSEWNCALTNEKTIKSFLLLSSEKYLSISAAVAIFSIQ